MKILQIIPAEKTAIATLAHQIKKHAIGHEIRIATFHPKKPNDGEVKRIKEGLIWADLVDAQYWKSASKVRDMFPDLWPKKPKILTHYNPYDLEKESWEDYKQVIVVNNYQASVLKTAKLLPLCIDLDFFKMQKYYTPEPVIHMSVSRIEGKKGVLEVAQACKDLNYKFLLVGRISDANYMNKVKTAAGDLLDFRFDVSDKDLLKSYYEAAIHVCNSVDNFETGTMPVLEAMACGIPVLARPVGHVPDLNNGSNLHLLPGKESDVESIKTELKTMMGGRNSRIKMRFEGNKSVQDRSDKWRAQQYAELYSALM